MSEVKRMTFTSREVGGCETSKTEWVSLADYESLKAEVERLRKAGDALVFCMNLNSASSGNALRSWENAKEGKPSV